MSTNPNTVKSQDDLPTTNDGKRSSDVLLATIDRVIELEDWKMDMQAKYGSKSVELEKTKKQLAIAVDCLLTINALKDFDDADSMRIAYAMKQIEELDK